MPVSACSCCGSSVLLYRQAKRCADDVLVDVYLLKQYAIGLFGKSFVITDSEDQTCLYFPGLAPDITEPGTIYGPSDITVWFDCTACLYPNPCTNPDCEDYIHLGAIALQVPSDVTIDSDGIVSDPDLSGMFTDFTKVNCLDMTRIPAGPWQFSQLLHFGDTLMTVQSDSPSSECPPLQGDDLSGATWSVISTVPSANARFLQLGSYDTSDGTPPSTLTVNGIIGQIISTVATSSPLYTVWDGTIAYNGSNWGTAGSVSIPTADGKYHNEASGLAFTRGRGEPFEDNGLLALALSGLNFRQIGDHWTEPLVFIGSQFTFTQYPLYISLTP